MGIGRLITMNKTALICGVSGQDGSLLARFLLEKGYKVVGTSRDARSSSFRNLVRLGVRDAVQYESMSLVDFRSVAQVLDKVKPDEIYNFSGQSSLGLSFEMPVETLESHALGALNILEAMRFLRLDARLFNASSGECFGSTDGIMADENTRFHPKSPYAVAKSAAFWTLDNYREAYGLYACSGILFNHESHLRGFDFVTRKITHAAASIKLGLQEKLSLGNLNASRDWGHAEDYVRCMWLMLQQDVPEDYVIATGESHTVRDFAECAFKAVGMSISWHGEGVDECGVDECGVVRIDVNPEFFRLVEVDVLLGDAGKAHRQLGWHCEHVFSEMVHDMVQEDIKDLEPVQ